MQNYTIFHCHSMLSNGVTNIDSITNFRSYIELAKNEGMNALCFSEHGSVFEWVHKKEEIEKAGMKYIHASEVYITESINEKVRDNYHCVLISRNLDGVHELNSLISKSFNRKDGHFYYMPRISFDELINTSDNIIVSTACFDENTNVITNRGILGITEINSGDMVLTSDGNYNKVISPTNRLYTGNMYHIKAQGMVDKLLCTENHKFFVYRSNNPVWIEVKDIQKDDLLLTPIDNKINTINNIDIEFCRNLNTAKKVKNRLKSYNVQVSKDLLTLLGIYCAEGSFMYNSGGIRFTLNSEDNKINKFVLNKMSEIFGLNPYIKEKKGQKAFDLEYSSTEIFKLFSEWFKSGAENKAMPSFIKYLSPSMQMYFLKGLYLGDGHYDVKIDKRDNSKAKRINVTTISKQLAFDIIHIFNRNRINPNVVVRKGYVDNKGVNHKKSFYVDLNSNIAEYLNNFIFNDVYNEFDISLLNLRKSHDTIKYCDGEYMTHKVKMIRSEHVVNKRVYCLNVDVDHSFVANNVVVHNCLGGILHNGNDVLKERFIKFLTKNKHRCFLEIQHHNDIKGEQAEYNQYLYDLHKRIGIPLIAGTDTHALNDEHMEGRRVLQKSKGVHFENEDSWDLTFKTYNALVAAYKLQNALPEEVFLEAIENTNVLANMIDDFKLDRAYKYPHLWENPEQIFRDKINDGIKRRGVDKYPNYQEYLDRIEHELKAYIHNGAIDFMLLMEDIISWCTQNDIQVGYGRGSVNGSVIAWLLGITEMDSIKHKLNFERFMNTERVSLSDIDTDLPPSRRNNVKDYIYSKTGLYCCDIITFNTIALKGAIRDVARYFEIPLDEVGNICNSVELEEESLRKKYPELFKYVDLVNGVIVSVGSHPCGLVVAPFDIEPEFGTFTTSTSDYPISQINMKEIDGLNYVKLDLLALDTIELINETCKLAGIERLTPDNVDITDIKVWNAIRDDTTQVFQWEGSTGNDYIKKLLSDENIERFSKINANVDRMTLLSIGNSAIRPAGASYRDDLANGIVRKIGSEAIDEFLSNTFGYLVFQEQIIEFLHSYCGFTMGEADIVRRHFAKKTGTETDIPVIEYGGYLDTEKQGHYIDGYIETMKKQYDMTEKQAKESIEVFLQVIIDASFYLFSLNHSQPYSYEGYISGYLRTYYPLEFLTVAFNINQDKEEKTAALTQYAKKNGIQVKSPVFRHSKGKYFFDRRSNSIYKGIGSLKYFNSDIADKLFELKEHAFTDFIDLLVTLNSDTNINTRQLGILIKIDYFNEFGDINDLLYYSKMFDELYGKKQIKKDKAKILGLPENLVRKCSQKESDKTFTGLNTYQLLKELLNIKRGGCSIFEKVNYQREFLGYVDIVNKNCAGVVSVLNVDAKYTPKVTLYAIANGNIIETMVDKRTFYRNPIETGQILKIRDQYSKPKQIRNSDGKWTDIPGTKIWWLTDYREATELDIRKETKT